MNFFALDGITREQQEQGGFKKVLAGIRKCTLPSFQCPAAASAKASPRDPYRRSYEMKGK